MTRLEFSSKYRKDCERIEAKYIPYLDSLIRQLKLGGIPPKHRCCGKLSDYYDTHVKNSSDDCVVLWNVHERDVIVAKLDKDMRKDAKDSGLNDSAQVTVRTIYLYRVGNHKALFNEHFVYSSGDAVLWESTAKSCIIIKIRKGSVFVNNILVQTL